MSKLLQPFSTPPPAPLPGSFNGCLSQVGFPDLAKASGALQNVFKIVDRKSPIDPSSSEGVTLDSRTVKGDLELQNVMFAYPARPSIMVFNNFCLTIPAGKGLCQQPCLLFILTSSRCAGLGKQRSRASGLVHMWLIGPKAVCRAVWPTRCDRRT